MGGALVKTLLELSLSLKVPVVNGLCFRPVSSEELGRKLARGAIHMASVGEGKKEAYTGAGREGTVHRLVGWLVGWWRACV